MTIKIDLQPGKKVYFASDFHLGVPDKKSSLEREKRIVRWLEQAEKDMQELILVGDIFDFWFEYSHVIPKGFLRFQGKLAEIADKGIPITFFIGNHDMWMFRYFKEELGVTIHRTNCEYEINEKKLFIGHGDGLAKNDRSYRFLKFFFRSRVCIWLFARLHPNLGMAIAKFWSRKSRAGNNKKHDKFLGENEHLLKFCQDQDKKNHFDYYVFGHRHFPMDVEVNPTSRYVNLGEWINYNTYAEFDGDKLTLKEFEKE